MSDFQSKGARFGKVYEDHVAEWLTERHFAVIDRNVRHESGVEFDLVVKDFNGQEFGVECKASDASQKRDPGMKRSDQRWKVLGYLYALRLWREQTGQQVRYILITSDMPDVGSAQRHLLDLAELVGDLQIIVVPAPVIEDVG